MEEGEEEAEESQEKSRRRHAYTATWQLQHARARSVNEPEEESERDDGEEMRTNTVKDIANTRLLVLDSCVNARAASYLLLLSWL